MYAHHLILREHRRLEDAAGAWRGLADAFARWQAGSRLAGRIAACLAAEQQALIPALLLLAPETVMRLQPHHERIRARANEAMHLLACHDLRSHAVIEKLLQEWMRYAVRVRAPWLEILHEHATDREQRQIGGEMLLVLAARRAGQRAEARAGAPASSRITHALGRKRSGRMAAPWMDVHRLPVLRESA